MSHGSKTSTLVLACYSAAAGSFTVSWRCRHTIRNNCRRVKSHCCMYPGASLRDEKTIVSQANSRQQQHVPGLLELRHGASTPGADAERSAFMNQHPDLRTGKLRRCSASKQMYSEERGQFVIELPPKRKCVHKCPRLKLKLEFTGVKIIIIINIDTRLT